MLKKIASFIFSAAVAVSGCFASTAVSAAEINESAVYTDYITEGHMNVYDLLKVKRSLAANDGRYTADNYDYILKFLVGLFDGEHEYAKKVVISYDTEGATREHYSDPSVIDPIFKAVGTTLSFPQHSLEKPGATHAGWLYDGVSYKQKETMIVPDHNITIKPFWHYYHTITYLAGDYDDLIGQDMSLSSGIEGYGVDLADSTKFSRKGYTLSGWECDLGGKTYGISARYTVPDTDVTFTAVWTPATVEINISANNGNSLDKITLKLKTGEELILPECEFENPGKTFTGWNYSGTIYQPGDSIIIPALIKGQKGSISAKWA